MAAVKAVNSFQSIEICCFLLVELAEITTSKKILVGIEFLLLFSSFLYIYLLGSSNMAKIDIKIPLLMV